ncbi:MAG: ATP-binding protein [Anaerolineae bacterium]|nr:ATP-binding protein [Anaerolineae bacterium]
MRQDRHQRFHHDHRYEPWPGHHFDVHQWTDELHRKRRLVFRRFLFFTGLFFTFLLVGISILLWMFIRIWAGDGTPPLILVIAAGVILVAVLSLAGLATAAWGFRRYGSPMAGIMAAADAVAKGDLNVRVPEGGPREMFALTVSFNRMVRELQQADQQRRNLTADVAHELRTPLHIIQGNLEGMLDGIYPADEDHLEAILDETHLLARLVEDLQTLSMAESGQLSLKKEEVNIGDLLNDVATSFSSRAEMQKITIDVDVVGTASELSIAADASRLDQVLGNLVSNALRYTPEGGKLILRARREASEMIIDVIDSGEGIPEEDLPYIFNRFWRGDRSRAHKGGATSGLGLAICKQLVQAHGGQIEVRSQLHAGTTFIIKLPTV